MNKIVALWCHPRSMSTSVERIMRERGDFTCLHEPFMYHYYLNQQQRDMPYFEPKADHPIRYEDVRDMIKNKANSSPVFFKDMAYYVAHDIIKDHAFCQSITHCFLIRSPQAAIGSYYFLDKEVSLTEIGIEAQWHIYSHLRKLNVEPIVVEAEAIRKNAQFIMKKYWESLRVKYKENVFAWSNEHPEDWNQVRGWHSETIASLSITPWHENDTRKEFQRFEAAANEAPHLRKYLTHHQEFYNRLKEQSVLT